MKSIYCTLFNYDYLAKGLALYRSMERCMNEFHLYILAMDALTRHILNAIRPKEATVLYYEDLISDEVRSVLGDRVGPSFFWTFTPLIVEYVISEKHEDWCTYIDADCFFFKDPAEVFDIIEDGDYSIGLVEHRYRRDEEYEKWCNLDGRFNVAFNTFRNEENSLRIIREWKSACVDCCTNRPTGDKFGDQLYLNEWPNKYDRIYIVDKDGIDIAPWNVSNYSVESKNGSFFIRDENTAYEVYMYHFHALSFMTKRLVSLNIWNPKSRRESKYLYRMYREYIAEIGNQWQLVEKYARGFNGDDYNGDRGIMKSISTRFREIRVKIAERRDKSLRGLIRNIMII